MMDYERIYQKKREKLKNDGNVEAFNNFIEKAIDLMIKLNHNEISEKEYRTWLLEQEVAL